MIIITKKIDIFLALFKYYLLAYHALHACSKFLINFFLVLRTRFVKKSGNQSTHKIMNLIVWLAICN